MGLEADGGYTGMTMAIERNRLLWAPPSGAALAMLLFGALALGRAPLAVALGLVQAGLCFAAIRILGVRYPGILCVAMIGTCVGADIILSVQSDRGAGTLLPVLGLAFVACSIGLVFRVDRSRLVEVFAAAIAASGIGVFGSLILVVRDPGRGGTVVALSLISAALMLAVSGIADLIASRPMLVDGIERGMVGAIVGLAAAAGLGTAYGVNVCHLPVREALIIAGSIAVLTLLTSLGVSTLAPRVEVPDWSLRLVAAAVPVLFVGPVAYLCGQLLYM